LFKRYSYFPLGELLAKKLPAVDFFGVMLWQWFYFTLMIVLYFFLAKILTWITAFGLPLLDYRFWITAFGLPLLDYRFWITAFGIKRVYKKVSGDVLRFIKEPFTLLMAVILARNFHDEANVTIALKAVTEDSTQ